MSSQMIHSQPVVQMIGNRAVGEGQPCYIIGEIGINHNGSLEIVRQMIEGAAKAGADAVKFQKRTPELCVPRDQWQIERDTPWGRMTYIDYRHKVEFTFEDYKKIDAICRENGIQWFASCWDEEAVAFMERFETPVYKVASASLTDLTLLDAYKKTGKPIMLSTGMSTQQEIDLAVDFIGRDQLLLAHSVSTYPAKLEELNLSMIQTLKSRYEGVPIGYSGHETGLAPTVAAVAMGATFVERHITIDRAMWGTDQAASLEMVGLERLVRDIRDIEKARGDGIKRVYESELASKKKLRRIQEPMQLLSLMAQGKSRASAQASLLN